MARLVIAQLLLSTTASLALAAGSDDPFTPPVRASATSESTGLPSAAGGLSGVRIGTLPAALIDGTWIRPGQTVRGARLEDVRVDGASLRHPNGRLEHLTLIATSATTAAESGRVWIRFGNSRGQP
ncbi:MAG TPA: hypothetical protein VIY30_17080 [Burkholderiaceae bacterium]